MWPVILFHNIGEISSFYFFFNFQGKLIIFVPPAILSDQ